MMKLTPKRPSFQAILKFISGICGVAVTTTVSVLLVQHIHYEQHERVLVASVQERTAQTDQVTTYRAALFLGADLPALRAQTRGMLDIMKSHNKKLELRTYYHHSNPLLLQQQIEEAISSEPDVILTVGTLASQTATQFLAKRKSSIPQLFSNVMNPLECGVSKTKELTGFHSTGLAEDHSNNLEGYVTAIKTIRPNVKRTLVIFNDQIPILEQQAEAIRQKLREKDIACRFVPVHEYGDITHKARTFITPEVDVVITLRDYLTNRAIPILAKLCSHTETTLFASDGYSVEQGAAASHCIDEYEIGLLIGAHLVKALTAENGAGSVPVQFLDASKLCSLHVNPFTMHKQGVKTPLAELLCKKGVVITHSPEKVSPQAA